jgi:hypothetical protein
VEGQLPAGIHVVSFNAGTLASGVYLYRIEAKGADGSRFDGVKKLVLLK